MLNKDYVLCIILLMFTTNQPAVNPISSDQQTYLRTTLKFKQIINKHNVNTRLKDIPESDIKTLYDYPLEYVAKTKLYFDTIPEELFSVIDHLLSVGADPNIYTLAAPLLAFACLNNYYLVKQMIQHKAEVKPSALTQIIRNLMLAGKQYLDPDIIATLIEHGADIHYKDVGFNQPVLFYTYHPVVVYSLLSHGADPRVKNSDGQTCKQYWLEFYNETKNLRKSTKLVTLYEKLMPNLASTASHRSVDDQDETDPPREPVNVASAHQPQTATMFQNIFMYAFWRCVNDEPELLEDIMHKAEQHLYIKRKIESMFVPETLQHVIQPELQEQFAKKHRLNAMRKPQNPTAFSCSCSSM